MKNLRFHEDFPGLRFAEALNC